MMKKDYQHNGFILQKILSIYQPLFKELRAYTSCQDLPEETYLAQELSGKV